MRIVGSDFTRRANQFLLKWHLVRKDWETETEHQIKLEQYKIQQLTKELENNE